MFVKAWLVHLNQDTLFSLPDRMWALGFHMRGRLRCGQESRGFTTLCHFFHACFTDDADSECSLAEVRVR